MAYSKRLKAANVTNQERAIAAYESFLNFVLGKVKKVGIENVLKSHKTAFNVSEYFWLKESFMKVLAFAEEVQIKQIPQKIGGEGIDGAIEIKVITLNPDENGNYLQAPRFAVPDIS